MCCSRCWCLLLHSYQLRAALQWLANKKYDYNSRYFSNYIFGYKISFRIFTKKKKWISTPGFSQCFPNVFPMFAPPVDRTIICFLELKYSEFEVKIRIRATKLCFFSHFIGEAGGGQMSTLSICAIWTYFDTILSLCWACISTYNDTTRWKYVKYAPKHIENAKNMFFRTNKKNKKSKRLLIYLFFFRHQ